MGGDVPETQTNSACLAKKGGRRREGVREGRREGGRDGGREGWRRAEGPARKQQAKGVCVIGQVCYTLP